MPTIQIIFNLPEENDEYQSSINGSKYHYVIHELFNYLRSESKYRDRSELTIEEVREKLVELLKDEGVLDDFS
jgi:hypothetical protein